MTDLDRIKRYYFTLLGFDMTDSKYTGHPFFNSYNKLLALDPQSDDFKYIIYNNLFGPIEYLEKLRRVDNSAFETWKNRLIKNPKNVALYGDIFELYFHWTLAEKKLSFKNRENPDFSINYETEIFVECTSALFDFTKEPSEQEIFQKIKKSVRKKLVLDYMNSTTVLFVDITNPIFHAKKLKLDITQDYLSSVLENINGDFKKNPPKKLKSLGAIVFVYFDYYKDENTDWKYRCNVAHHLFTDRTDEPIFSFLKSNFIRAEPKSDVVNPKFHH